MTLPARRAAAHLALIGLAGVAVYANALRGEFVYDDEFLILRNRHVQAAALGDMFTSSTTAGAYRASNFYRPLQLLAYAAVYRASGLRVVAYHLLNVGLHVANALLLYGLLWLLMGAPWTALAAALLFVVHPVHTSAVAYISGTADPLACGFALLALLCHIREDRPRLYRPLEALCVAGALLSKEVMIMLPGLMVIVDAYRRVPLRARWPRYLPALAIVAIYLLARLTVFNFVGSLNPYGEANVYTEHLSNRVFTFLAFLGEYAKVLLLPLSLHYDRVQVVFPSLAIPAVFLPLAGAVALSVAAARSWRGARTLFFGWTWFLVALAPTSGIALPVNGFAKDHWLYVPAIGFCAVLATGVARLGKLRWPVLLALAAGWGTLTVLHNRAWHDPVALYTHILSQNPKLARIHNNLAMAYADRRQRDLAERHYTQAITLDDSYAETRYNLGRLYLEQGRVQEALAQFTRALELEPDFLYAHVTLEELYSRLGRVDDARREAQRIQEIASRAPQPAPRAGTNRRAQ